jgi:hypothetical protein
MSNVVNIGDYRFTHTNTKFKGGCPHKNLVMDENGHTVRCEDCNTQLSAHYVLGMILSEYNRSVSRLQRDAEELRKQAQKNLHLRVTQNLERIWRGNMVPCCPHCGEGILLSDNLGSSAINKSFVIRKREVPA